MAHYSIWDSNALLSILDIKDKFKEKQITTWMKSFKLSDATICALREDFQNEMAMGLNQCQTGFYQLAMKETYITDQYSQTGTGKFIAICAHAHSFSITLLELQETALPAIHRKDYFIDQSVFQKSSLKIYKEFAKCVKDFFLEYNLDGEVIPASICTDLEMKQHSLSCSVIPNFCRKAANEDADVKALFECVLQQDEFQGKQSSVTFNDDEPVETLTGTTDTDRVFHGFYDAVLLGSEGVQGLKITLDACRSLFAKLRKPATKSNELPRKVSLDISHAGIKICDKVFKSIIYDHRIHKLSHVVQDSADASVFGYLWGNFMNGHEFFVFKASRNAMEIIAFIGNVIRVELIRKKKEKLELQASQVFLTLRSFLKLAHEFRARAENVPIRLSRNVMLVENINWWMEGCLECKEEPSEELEETILYVQLQELYAAAVRKKQLEIEKELARKREQEEIKSTGRRRRKKQPEVEVAPVEEPVKELTDPLTKKALKIIKEVLSIFERLKEQAERKFDALKIKLDALDHASESTSLNQLRDFCFTNYNSDKQDVTALNSRIESMEIAHKSELDKVKFQIPDPYFGNKQHLVATKKLVKDNIFEDITFEAPKRISTPKSEVLNKLFICDDYFTTALKMRKEEVAELNYFISTLHFRETILNPKDSKTVDFCRRLLVKAIKMRFKEIYDIQSMLNELKQTKEKIVLMIPTAIKISMNCLQVFLKEKKILVGNVGKMLSEFNVDLKPSVCKVFY